MTTTPESAADVSRRRWPKRLFLTTLVLANVVAVVAFLQIRSADREFAENVGVNDEVVQALDPTIPKNESGSNSAERSVTFLLIGSDSREGLDSLKNFGEAPGERADVVIVLKIYPDSGRAQMLSLPRDLYVDIPGEGKGRINAAFAFGGAPLMVETVRQFTGVPINHYVEVDFVGFQAIVDQLGGVSVDFPYPARDIKSGLNVAAGTQVLDGFEALAFARSRSYQELQEGSWVSVDATDFGRTRRQQQLIFSILSELTDPTALFEISDVVGTFAEYLTVDALLAQDSLVALAIEMRAVRPGQIEAVTLPGDVTMVGEASVVVPTEPEADQILANLRAGEPMVTFDQSALAVHVVNGNGVSGSAGSMAERLEVEGFEIAGTGNADRKDFAKTTILVRPDTIAFGELIAGELGYGVVEVGSIDSHLGALVIVGLDDVSATG